jgi:hypothetical protein
MTPESLLSEEAAVGMNTMLAPGPPANCTKRSIASLPPLAITSVPVRRLALHCPKAE